MTTSTNNDALLQAFEVATRARLICALKALLPYPQAVAVLERQLLITEALSPAEKEQRKKRTLDTYLGQEPINSPVKKKPRFLTCVQCDKEYDVSKNASDACVWHDGKQSLAPNQQDVILTLLFLRGTSGRPRWRLLGRSRRGLSRTHRRA